MWIDDADDDDNDDDDNDDDDDGNTDDEGIKSHTAQQYDSAKSVVLSCNNFQFGSYRRSGSIKRSNVPSLSFPFFFLNNFFFFFVLKKEFVHSLLINGRLLVGDCSIQRVPFVILDVTPGKKEIFFRKKHFQRGRIEKN